MLDKYKARKQKIGQAIEDFEATHDNVRKTHEHLSKHRAKYGLAVGTGIGVGATIVVMTKFGGTTSTPDLQVNPANKNTMLLSYKSAQTAIQKVVVEVPARADRGHVIIDAATGLPVGGSLTEAAANEGISRASLLKNTRGVTDFAVNGKQYIDLGENLSEAVTREVFA